MQKDNHKMPTREMRRAIASGDFTAIDKPRIGASAGNLEAIGGEYGFPRRDADQLMRDVIKACGAVHINNTSTTPSGVFVVTFMRNGRKTTCKSDRLYEALLKAVDVAENWLTE